MHEADALSLFAQFEIETPSWGYADTGTRFGKFFQAAAAATTTEKLADAATVNRFTGAAPKMAVHALWDFGSGPEALGVAKTLSVDAKALGMQIGAVNPNLFQDQIYKFGSSSSPVAQARDMADAHVLECLQLAAITGSRDISLWFADGTNYPGQDDIRTRKRHMEAALKKWHAASKEGQRLLVEYKPFEPAFYHTDIADWGMALHFAKVAGPRAKVLVDTGHHLPGCNIEHIVAFLLDEGMLGGFHFNDRKYADDDLTLGSIDPYAVFRIFHEILNAVEEGRAQLEDISFCIDQSHNLKPKIEAMIQTVASAQALFMKAALVDRKKLAERQAAQDIVGAERVLVDAFETDVRPMLAEVRLAKGVAADPITAYRESGHQAKLEAERGERNRSAQGKSSYA
jgi:L-rhamnose isomerase/sugar isomerase